MPFYACSSEYGNNEYKKQMKTIKTELDKLFNYIGTSSTESSYPNVPQFSKVINKLTSLVDKGEDIPKSDITNILGEMITIEQTCFTCMTHIKKKVDDLIAKASNSPQ